MTKPEFITFLDTKTDFTRHFHDDDDSWRREIDYANAIWDTLDIHNDSVQFNYDELDWGSTEYKSKTYSFDQFATAYTNDTLK